MVWRKLSDDRKMLVVEPGDWLLEILSAYVLF
jgi:hypothetical protein